MPPPHDQTPLAALAESVRSLIDLLVRVDDAAPVLLQAADTLRAVAVDLTAAVPERRRPHLVEGAATLADAMPFDLVVGPCNPLAVPLTLTTEPPVAVASGTYPLAYQGAPGCVHGGAITAGFDIVLTAANSMSGPAGPTVDLQVRFRRPTAVNVPLRYEAEVQERTDRRVVSQGRLLQDGEVTATATGTFAVLTSEQIRRLAERRRTS